VIGGDKYKLPIMYHKIMAFIIPLPWPNKILIYSNQILRIIFLMVSYWSIGFFYEQQAQSAYIILISFTTWHLLLSKELSVFSKFGQRYYSSIVTSASIFLVYQVQCNAENLLLSASTLIIIAVALISSKFALQTLILYFPIHSILSLSFIPITYLLIVIGAMILFSPKLRTHLKDQIEFLRSYKNFQNINFYANYEKVSKIFGKSFAGNKIFRFYIAMINSKYKDFVGVYSLIAISALCLGKDLNIIQSSVIITLLIISILTSTHFLYNLGEGYRYLQYGGYIIIPAVGAEILSLNEIYIIGISSLVIASLLSIASHTSEFWRSQALEEKELAKTSFEFKKNDIVAVWHYKKTEILALYNCNALLFSTRDYDRNEEFRSIFSNYPYVKKCSSASKKYGVTHYIERYEEKDGKFKIIIQDKINKLIQ
jgi:hypothetical protein